MTKKLKIISLAILLMLMLLVLNMFFLRLVNSKEIDDVSPEIYCEQEYFEKSNILWIVPKFNNSSMSQNKSWCNYILSLNKTLGMHGVSHTYEEFGEERNQEYLREGIIEFEKCFNFTPEMFKPPQLKISEQNKQLIKNNNLKLKGKINQITHKVYHCEDTGMFPNLVVDIL